MSIGTNGMVMATLSVFLAPPLRLLEETLQYVELRSCGALSLIGVVLVTAPTLNDKVKRTETGLSLLHLAQ